MFAGSSAFMDINCTEEGVVRASWVLTGNNAVLDKNVQLNIALNKRTA